MFLGRHTDNIFCCVEDAETGEVNLIGVAAQKIGGVRNVARRTDGGTVIENSRMLVLIME